MGTTRVWYLDNNTNDHELFRNLVAHLEVATRRHLPLRCCSSIPAEGAAGELLVVDAWSASGCDADLLAFAARCAKRRAFRCVLVFVPDEVARSQGPLLEELADARVVLVPKDPFHVARWVALSIAELSERESHAHEAG